MRAMQAVCRRCAPLGCPSAPSRLRPSLQRSIRKQQQHQTHVFKAAGTLTTAAAAPTQAAPASFAADGSELRPLPRVVLKGGKAKLFTGDSPSPMVYSGAVDRVVGRPTPKAGDTVVVCDGSEKPIGWGVYNPASMFRVRMMQLADECFGGGAALVAGQLRPDLQQLVSSRIQQAVSLRAALGLRCGPAAGSGSAGSSGGGHGEEEGTSVFRLCNSEGDRLSGLVVDVLGQHLVVASSAAWVERHREAITACLQEATGLTSVIWRPSTDMLKEEGCGPNGVVAEGNSAGDEADGAEVLAEAEAQKAAAVAAGAPGSGAGEAEEAPRAEEGAPEAAAPGGSSSGSGGGGAVGEREVAADLTSVVRENGILYAASPLGQKTGFYADQRDNRAALRHLSAGARTLDLCCYTGGFALSAAAGGATSVTGVDSSAPAVTLAARNAELNGVSDVCSFVKADVGEFMKQALADKLQWDVVVFDPPKLAPSRKTLEKATRKYKKLNSQAMKLVAPGGLLMTCSCSGAMCQSGDFVPTLQAAARDAGRRITVLRVAGAGPDHPVDPTYPEGQYLTNVLLRVL